MPRRSARLDASLCADLLGALHLQHSSGAAPIIYEFGDEEIVLRADRPLHLRPPLGEAASSPIARIARSAPPSAPDPARTPTCLVSTSTDEHRRVLVDLVAAGITSVTGPDAARDAFISAAIEEAKSGRWSAPARVLVIGSERPEAGRDDDAVPAREVGEVLEVLARLAGQGAALTATRPTLTVCRGPLTAAALEELASIAGLPGFGLVTVEPTAHARLLLAPEEARHAMAYLRAVEQDGEESVPNTTDALPAVLVPPVEIAILGATEIRGAERSLMHRPKLTELVVYLAMHPEGATARTWTAALWPERQVPQQTVANRLSEARRFLGFGADQRPRLRRNGERHRLAGVVTDWERFCNLAGTSDDPESWRRALELVRGHPFDDLQQGQWTIFEGFTAEIEQAIANCAQRYGDHCLTNGDPDGAAWAAQKALRACPYDERLHRLLMRAADAAGNRGAVEAILQNLALVLEIDGDPLRGVHPETAALYARLSGRLVQERR